MGAQMNLMNQATILNKIIDSAAELPLESQDLLLMIAKSMKYTRDCMIEKNRAAVQPVQKGRCINA